MNAKSLDTPVESFSPEELEAMDDDEMMVRGIITAGDLGTMIQGIAVEAAQEIMGALHTGHTLASILGEDEPEAVSALIPALGEHIISSVIAAMQVAREVERFALANPEFPDTDPATLFAALHEALSDEVASR